MSKIVIIVCYCVCLLQPIASAEEYSEPKKKSFEELTKHIHKQRQFSSKLELLNIAVSEHKDKKAHYLKRLTPLFHEMITEGEVTFDHFRSVVSKLDNLKVPFTDDEYKEFLIQLSLSNKDRILYAQHCWERGLKEFSFGVAFNQQDIKRFNTYTNELKQVVVKMEKNPFNYRERGFCSALAERNLWPALANFWMCMDDKRSASRYSNVQPAIVGMMTLFGEDQVRSWVTDLDRRKTWLQSPLITAAYFYQQGKVDEAFTYLEDANLTNSLEYQILCYNSGRFDKFIDLYQAKIKKDAKLDGWQIFGIAFAAQQVGDEILYKKYLKLLREYKLGSRWEGHSQEDKIRGQRRHIQMLLALSEMELATELADQYGLSGDVFRLLCMSFKFELAHQYVRVGRAINANKYKAAEVDAQQFFTGINHPYSEQYLADWKPKEYRVKYQNPTENIKTALSANKKIRAKWLLDLEVAPENEQLEKQIVAHLLKGHFTASQPERKLLEKHGKAEFISQHYYKAYQKNNYSTQYLFLAGHYASTAGKQKQGERQMLAACVMSMNNDYLPQKLVNAILSVNPEYPKIKALRKMSRRALLASPGGRQCFYDAYNEKAHKDAARTWNSDHLTTLYGVGDVYRDTYYGRHWWAWHNNAHDDNALGQLALENGDLEKSYQHLLKVWKVSELMNQLGYNLYRAYLKKGETEKPHRIFDTYWNHIEKIYVQNPNHPWALTQLVSWSLACRKPLDGKALALAQKLHTMKGDSYYETRLLAEHYVLHQEPEKAREVLTPWLERRPRDKELLEFSTTLKLPKRDLKETWSLFGAFSRF